MPLGKDFYRYTRPSRLSSASSSDLATGHGRRLRPSICLGETMPKQIPGVLHDPWRSKKESLPSKPQPKETPSAPPEDEHYDRRFATIELKGYGGITIEDTTDPAQAAMRLLRFCTQEKDAIEPIFTNYGVIVANVKKPPARLTFYVHASDGSLLACPLAKTRDEGLLQLIQALMHLSTIPRLRDKLQKAKINPYKL